jgi:hypothetical protein
MTGSFGLVNQNLRGPTPRWPGLEDDTLAAAEAAGDRLAGEELGGERAASAIPGQLGRSAHGGVALAAIATPLSRIGLKPWAPNWVLGFGLAGAGFLTFEPMLLDGGWLPCSPCA